MYAVIAGGGKVGRAIAQDLLAEGHAVAIIELVAERVEGMLDDADDLLIIQGDATEIRFLAQARPERADVFVATTRVDEVNYVACQLARTSFEVPRVISRINFSRNEQLFERVGIEGVSTTTLISKLIREQAAVGDLIRLHTFNKGALNLVEIDLPEDLRPSSRTVAEMSLPTASILVAVFRGDETVIPRGDTILLPGDRLIALTTPELEGELRSSILGRRR